MKLYLIKGADKFTFGIELITCWEVSSEDGGVDATIPVLLLMLLILLRLLKIVLVLLFEVPTLLLILLLVKFNDNEDSRFLLVVLL